MRTTTRRLGLSFEIAPPRDAHPNRTDIACFVGTVARRPSAAVSGVVPMPPVLAYWLAGLGFTRLGGLDVATLSAALESRTAFVASVQAQAAAAEQEALSHALSFDTLDSATATRRTQQFEALVTACRTLSPLSLGLLDDLSTRAWVPRRLLGDDDLAGWLRVQSLFNLPIAIESFEAFDGLFDWQSGPVLTTPPQAGDPVVTTPLGAAVRAFFGEGGRRCWIVRTGDPVALLAPPNARFAACFPQPAMPPGDQDGPTAPDIDPNRCAQLTGVARLVANGTLAGVQVATLPPADEPGAWQGFEHVFGLQEVNFACLPDLATACAPAIPAIVPPAEQVAAAERFHECVAEAAAAESPAGQRLPAPRLDPAGLEVWRQLVGRATGLLANNGRAFHRRDVQCLASLPLAASNGDVPGESRWLEWMSSHPGWLPAENDGPGALGSDRLQLAYPWIATVDSVDCQGGIEAPEGTLAGVLARAAVQQGAFRSIANQPVARYVDAEPRLDWSRATQQDVPSPLGLMTLAERICLIGPSPRGARLLCDVTLSADAQTRQGAVRRLVNVVIQAARGIGDEFAFEPNGPLLWQRLRERLTDLGRVLLTAGALSTDGPPFVVRCGTETMSQADLDAGRLIAEIELLPAQPIQRIVVVLAMRDAQSVAGLQAELRAA